MVHLGQKTTAVFELTKIWLSKRMQFTTILRCLLVEQVTTQDPGRKYLPSDVNVKKMHELFLEQNEVKYNFYYGIFNYDQGNGPVPYTMTISTGGWVSRKCEKQIVNYSENS